MGYYKGKIKVIGYGLKCFPIDPVTLEALATSTYDPWALEDPDSEPIETIGIYEWYKRKWVLQDGSR